VTTEQSKAVVRRFFDTFNEHNIPIAELAADNYVLDFPGASGRRYGPPGLREATDDLLTAFPDLQFTLEEVIGEGDQVAVYWSMQGTHHGPLGPIPGTGTPVRLTGTSIFRLANGKIVSDRVRADLIGLLRQIGAAPAREPVGL
jgi:predicted ester cyclase